MANKIIQEMFKEMEDEKHLIFMDGQKRKIPMTCSFKNCGLETESILEAFKHYEKQHTLIATATSSYFIDQKKLFYFETPKIECNVIEIATIQHPFKSDEAFNTFIRSHYVKTNITNL